MAKLMGDTRRTRRLAALIKAELSDLMIKKVKDPRLELISITHVDVSPDLKQAKIYYSMMSETKPEQAQAGFKKACSFLRHELATRLHLKTTPRLEPIYDKSLVRGAAMSAFIDQVRAKDKSDRPGPDEEDQE
jgi:ribosome-binding factor A